MPIGSTTRPASPAPPSTGLGVGLLSAFVTPPDAGGLLVDSAGGRTATVANGPLGVAAAPLPGGAGWTFNGTNQHAPFSDTGLPTGSAAWSMAILFRTAVAGTDLGALSWGGASGPVVSSLGVLGAKLYWTTWTSGLTGAVAVDDGAWHLGVATYDGATVRVYTDGVPDGSAAVSLTLSTPGTAYVGALLGSANFYYGGDLAAAYIWGRCLADSDATALAADVWAPVRPDAAAFKPYFLAPSPALGSGVY